MSRMDEDVAVFAAIPLALVALAYLCYIGIQIEHYTHGCGSIAWWPL